jgi:two-component system sensor histidine kinase VicK
MNHSEQLDENRTTNDELRRLRRELEQTQQQLAQQQRGKTSMLAMAAHDLRTPLAIIQGYAHLLAAEPVAQSETTSEYVDTIVAHADSLGKIVDNLITLDQFEGGEMRLSRGRHDLNELVDHAIAQVEGLTKLKELVIRYRPASSAVWIDADAEQTGRALYNLLNHTIKYAHPGSEIRVEVNLPDPLGSVTLRDPQRNLSPQMISRLFDLVEINRDGPASLRGMDIGLVLARRVADIHGGAVWATSDADNGTALTLSLPISRNE